MTQQGNQDPEDGDSQANPQQSQDNSGQEGNPSKTFTQAEVDAMMGRVRGEERSKYKDYDSLKERAKVADSLEQASLTEKEKLERRAAEAERKAIDADSRIAETAIKAEIRVRAIEKGIVDPDAAYALIDQSSIEYDEDGNVSGVSDALDALITDKPYLKGARASAPNLNPDGRTPADAPVKLTDAERSWARRFGMSDEEYAKNKVIPT